MPDEKSEMMDEKIKCLRFKKKESIIKHINHKISMVNWVMEKAVLAEKLYEQLNILLSCPDHKPENPNCQSCHFTVGLYKKKASILISEELYKERKEIREHKGVILNYENLPPRAPLYRRLEKLIIKLKS